MARFHTTAALERMLQGKQAELQHARQENARGGLWHAEVKRLEGAVDDLETRLAEAKDMDQQERTAASEARAKVDVDEAQFWFRRFFTSLAIGNAGAFAALAAGVLQSDDRTAIAKIVFIPMVCLASGLASAGLLPLTFFVRSSLSNRFWWDRAARIHGDEDGAVQEYDVYEYEAYGNKRISQTAAVSRLVISGLGVLSALLFGAALLTSLMSVAGLAAAPAKIATSNSSPESPAPSPVPPVSREQTARPPPS